MLKFLMLTVGNIIAEISQDLLLIGFKIIRKSLLPQIKLFNESLEVLECRLTAYNLKNVMN